MSCFQARNCSWIIGIGGETWLNVQSRLATGKSLEAASPCFLFHGSSPTLQDFLGRSKHLYRPNWSMSTASLLHACSPQSLSDQIPAFPPSRLRFRTVLLCIAIQRYKLVKKFESWLQGVDLKGPQAMQEKMGFVNLVVSSFQYVSSCSKGFAHCLCVVKFGSAIFH